MSPIHLTISIAQDVITLHCIGTFQVYLFEKWGSQLMALIKHTTRQKPHLYHYAILRFIDSIHRSLSYRLDLLSISCLTAHHKLNASNGVQVLLG